MRVLFACYPQRTHFFLMAPLAWALRTAGHEVLFATQPGLVDDITAAGLSAVPVGRDHAFWRMPETWQGWLARRREGLPEPYDAALREPGEVPWEYLRDGMRYQVSRWHRTVNFPMTAELITLAQRWQPDLVLWETTTYAGAVAARACGAAHARMLFGPDVFGNTRRHYLTQLGQQPPAERADPLREWLEPYLRSMGDEFGEDMVTGQLTIDHLPSSLRINPAPQHLPMRYVPYGGPATVPAWLRDAPQRPRVVVSTGLSVGGKLEGYDLTLRDVLVALTDLPVEIVVTAPDEAAAGLTGLADNTRIIPYVPLQALAPTCVAAVHHAGPGTLATLALHGVPQLTLPGDFDEPILARRLAAQGAGLALSPATASPGAVRDGIIELLENPRFRERAARLRDEMHAMPSPNEVVGVLEHVVTHAPRRGVIEPNRPQ